MIAGAILIAYAAADLWWYRNGYWWVAGRGGRAAPIDPFAAPSSTTLPLSEHVSRFLSDRVFVNLAERYRQWTDPFRPRKDPEGTPYFLIDDPQIEAFSGPLRCMGETSLLSLDSLHVSAPEIYRLTILPCFEPDSPTSYRLHRESDQSPPLLRRVSVDPISAEITRDETLEIPEDLWENAVEMLNSPYFWNPPADIEPLQTMSMDGDLWLFERIVEGRHETLVLLSPDYFADLFDDGVLSLEKSPDWSFRIYGKVRDVFERAGPQEAP